MSENAQHRLCIGDHAAWVEVAGKPAQIYSVTADVDLNKSTAFIESSYGATFTIHLLCDKPGFKRDYVFRAPTFTDDPARASLRTEQVGTIEIRAFKVKDVCATGCSPVVPDLNDFLLDEAQHKAEISHVASLGEARASGYRNGSTCTYLTPKNAPEYTWEFRYRSRDILELNGQIKVKPIEPPAPPPFVSFKRPKVLPPAELPRPIAELPRRVAPTQAAFSFWTFWPFKSRKGSTRKEPTAPSPHISPKSSPPEESVIAGKELQVPDEQPRAPSPPLKPRRQPQPAVESHYSLRRRAPVAPPAPIIAPPPILAQNNQNSKGKKRNIESLDNDSEDGDNGADSETISDLKAELARLTERLAKLEGKPPTGGRKPAKKARKEM
ncbi:hypothetical protein RQP46_000236 [Phenoliferia psychrophenolica]